MADFTRADVAHLLRRAAFGGRPAEIDALVALPDWSAVVDRVLDTDANPPDPIPVAVDDRDDPWWPAYSASVQHWIDRMATSPTPVVEKVTLFWHSNLATSTDGVYPRLVHRQIRTYRARALGDVHELLQAMAIDPAMLLYLDNASNVAESPNENFARELMELFTLGQGPYTEADVVGMARAWTGHNLDEDTERYRYVPADHDTGAKTIFGLTRNWDGPEALTEIVRGTRQQACARYLAAKVWAFFAAPNPAPAVVDTLAAAFVSSGMVVRELLRAVFEHPDFRLATTRAALVRSPVEWFVAAMRGVELPATDLHPEWWLDRMGQALMQPPNVAGWRGGTAWISTSAQWGKGAFASWIRWKASELGVLAETEALAPGPAATAAFARFGIDDPSPLTRQRLEEYVARERAARRAWAVPQGLVALTVLSPDFQLA